MDLRNAAHVQQKDHILFRAKNSTKLLNSKSEIFSRCKHMDKTILSNWRTPLALDRVAVSQTLAFFLLYCSAPAALIVVSAIGKEKYLGFLAFFLFHFFAPTFRFFPYHFLTAQLLVFRIHLMCKLNPKDCLPITASFINLQISSFNLYSPNKKFGTQV